MQKISIVGLGYIGLPTALIAANNGYDVVGFDVDAKKVASITNGVSPIVEPGIQTLLSELIKKKNFSATTTLPEADCFVIAVPTPFTGKKQAGLKQAHLKQTSPKQASLKKADLSYVLQAGKAVGEQIRPGNLVILESTVPVGTTQKLTRLLEKTSGLKASKDFFVAYCPERVLPGHIMHELVHNDRIIGGICKKSSNRAKEFYAQFVQGTCHITTDKTAEMVKLIENSSRDVQIAFANQIAGMCETAKINPFDVIDLANKHPRVNILQPGCGVGGHCIAVDPWFLIETFPDATKLLRTARAVNDAKPKRVVAAVLTAAHTFTYKHKQKPRVLILGLTFKPDVDDTRESPALEIARALATQTSQLDLFVCEPFVPETTLESWGLKGIKDAQKACDASDIIVALVAHTCFKDLQAKPVSCKKIAQKNSMHTIVIDPCGLFSKK